MSRRKGGAVVIRKMWRLALVLVLLTSTLAAPALAQTEEEIQVAIESGVVWLVDRQNDDGSWGTWEQVARTGFAVVKLEDRAIELGYDSPFDPGYQYSENVEKGLDYIFANAHVISISVQPPGDPDTNGNDQGVYFTAGWQETYNTGIAMMAIAASRDPDRLVTTGPLAGQTYKQVLQDAVDYFAFGQCDSGWGRGGWWYTHNVGGADNSNSGYAVLGLRYAESYGFECTVPQFVRDELSIWIDHIQNDDGGSGYSDPGHGVNILKTGNLLFEMAFVGDNVNTQRVKDAIAYIERHWDDLNDDPGWRGFWPPWENPAHKQAMYCAMKGFEAFDIDTISVWRTIGFDNVDWFDEFAEVLLVQQNDDGSWDWDCWGDNLLGTEWALLTLEKVVPPPEVVIDIKPGSYPNSINPDSRGTIPVAIFSTESFDAPAMVDPSSLRFGPAAAPIHMIGPKRNPKPHCSAEYVNGDDLLDLVCHFETREAGFQEGDDEGVLKGTTYEGMEFTARDSVRIVPPNKPSAVTDQLQVLVSPNPVRDVDTATFQVMGMLAAQVEGIRVQIYDLSGHMVWEDATLGSELDWHTDSLSGDYLANGIYLYSVQVRISGSWINQDIGKIAVLR